MKYVKKPVVIEAFCFNELYPNCPKWFEDFQDKTIQINGNEVKITIATLEGDMSCTGDDYIIQGVDGELYPCRRDIFLKTYEKIRE